MSNLTLSRVIDVSVSEQRYAPFDARHGTPDEMVRRLATLRLPEGQATFEQTDYGHPGRFNPWEPRGIDPKLQPHAAELRAVCAALSALM